VKHNEFCQKHSVIRLIINAIHIYIFKHNLTYNSNIGEVDRTRGGGGCRTLIKVKIMSYKMYKKRRANVFDLPHANRDFRMEY